jgi:hypothetical protein
MRPAGPARASQALRRSVPVRDVYVGGRHARGCQRLRQFSNLLSRSDYADDYGAFGVGTLLFRERRVFDMPSLVAIHCGTVEKEVSTRTVRMEDTVTSTAVRTSRMCNATATTARGADCFVKR